MSSGARRRGVGRRGMLLGAVAPGAACAGNSGFSPNDLVVIADAQRLVGDLRSTLDGMEQVVAAQDKGGDSRLRACRTSLDVVGEALDRAATLKPG